MNSRHYALIAGCMVGLGAMTSSLGDWRDALTPSFLGGLAGVIGTQLAAIFTDKP